MEKTKPIEDKKEIAPIEVAIANIEADADKAPQAFLDEVRVPGGGE